MFIYNFLINKFTFSRSIKKIQKTKCMDAGIIVPSLVHCYSLSWLFLYHLLLSYSSCVQFTPGPTQTIVFPPQNISLQFPFPNSLHTFLPTGVDVQLLKRSPLPFWCHQMSLVSEGHPSVQTLSSDQFRKSKTTTKQKQPVMSCFKLIDGFVT